MFKRDKEGLFLNEAQMNNNRISYLSRGLRLENSHTVKNYSVHFSYCSELKYLIWFILGLRFEVLWRFELNFCYIGCCKLKYDRYLSRKQHACRQAFRVAYVASVNS